MEITCAEFRRECRHHLGGVESLPVAIQGHALTCTARGCRAAWQELQWLETAIGVWRQESAAELRLPADLTDQVLAAWEHSRLPEVRQDSSLIRPQRTVLQGNLLQSTALPGRRVWPVASVVAACGVLLCVAWSLSLSGAFPEASSGALSGPAWTGLEAASRETDFESGREAPVWSASSAAKGGEDQALQTQVYRQLGELYVSWLEEASAGVSGSLIPVLNPSPGEGASSRRGWMQEFEEQWRPWEQELDRVLEDWQPESSGGPDRKNSGALRAGRVTV